MLPAKVHAAETVQAYDSAADAQRLANTQQREDPHGRPRTSEQLVPELDAHQQPHGGAAPIGLRAVAELGTQRACPSNIAAAASCHGHCSSRCAADCAAETFLQAIRTWLPLSSPTSTASNRPVSKAYVAHAQLAALLQRARTPRYTHICVRTHMHDTIGIQKYAIDGGLSAHGQRENGRL